MNSNNSSNDFQNKLLIEMFTVFVLQLEGNLNIKNNNYQSLDKLRLFEVKSRLDEIMPNPQSPIPNPQSPNPKKNI